MPNHSNTETSSALTSNKGSTKKLEANDKRSGSCHCSGCLRLCFPISVSLNVVFIIIIIVLSALVSQKSPVCPSCPEDWIMWKGKCYNFSDTEGTWNSSQKYCASHGASLFAPDTTEEMGFVMQYKGRTDYWIGLWREEKGQPWKWSNGSVFNNMFSIRTDGTCTYLDDKGPTSTWCDTQRNWICSKSLRAS